MSEQLDARTWLELVTADVPDRGVTYLALMILSQIEAETKRQGITYTELAARAGLNRAYLSRIINHPENVTLSTIVRIANALDLEVQPPKLVSKSRADKARPSRRKTRTREPEPAVG